MSKQENVMALLCEVQYIKCVQEYFIIEGLSVTQYSRKQVLYNGIFCRFYN